MKLKKVEGLPKNIAYPKDLQGFLKEFAEADGETAAKRSKRPIKVHKRGDRVFLVKMKGETK